LPFAVGLFLSLLPVLLGERSGFNFVPSLVWILFYGCALHSADFFMPRGIKYFGLIFVTAALGLIFMMLKAPGWLPDQINPHWLMGFFFGVLHLGYGAYLYLTEKKNPVA
jgi:hypothetical protein